MKELGFEAEKREKLPIPIEGPVLFSGYKGKWYFFYASSCMNILVAGTAKFECADEWT